MRGQHKIDQEIKLFFLVCEFVARLLKCKQELVSIGEIISGIEKGKGMLLLIRLRNKCKYCWET